MVPITDYFSMDCSASTFNDTSTMLAKTVHMRHGFMHVWACATPLGTGCAVGSKVSGNFPALSNFHAKVHALIMGAGLDRPAKHGTVS